MVFQLEAPIVMIKTFEFTINLLLIISYGITFFGEFLWIQAVWIPHEKLSTFGVLSEYATLVSLIAFFIYSCISLVQCFFQDGDQERGHRKCTIIRIVVNILGIFLFSAIGTMALINWSDYEDKNHDCGTFRRQNALLLSYLSITLAGTYLVDSILSLLLYLKISRD